MSTIDSKWNTETLVVPGRMCEIQDRNYRKHKYNTEIKEFR